MRAGEASRKVVQALGLLVFSAGLTVPQAVAQHTQTVGLFQNDPGAFAGYTVFSARNGTIYMIDMEGRLVHSWAESGQPAVLLENGNLLVGRGGVKEIAWDGTIVWQYNHSTAHHDFERLPNGNVLLVTRESKTYAEAIAAGRDPALVTTQDGLLPLHIIEVEPTPPVGGTIVWEWHVWDHMIQDFDPDKANYGAVEDHPELIDLNWTTTGSRSDWQHTNAIHYNPALDQIIVSPRAFSELWVIDHSTTTAEAASHMGGNSGKGGDLLYRWGNPQAYRAGTSTDQMLFQQHDTHWIDPGLIGGDNILIFNNGYGARSYSSVDEVVPPVDGYNYWLTPGSAYGPPEPVWSYVAPDPTAFFARTISSAQRLPNGNTLIDDGPHGTFFEVTPEGDTVWRYVNPVTSTGMMYQGDPAPPRFDGGAGFDNAVFRCYRYGPDYPGLTGKDLTPGAPIELYDVDVTPTCQIDRTNEVIDELAGEVSMMVTWTNTGANPNYDRLRMIIESIFPGTATVANADGTTVDGRPYFDYSAFVDDGILDPAETSEARQFIFYNDSSVTFDASCWAMPSCEHPDAYCNCTDMDNDDICVDQDCDDTNPYCTTDCIDGDGDAFCITHDCHDASPGCTTDCTDADADGLAVCAGDCDDTNPNCTTDCTDADGDGYCVTADCDDAHPYCTADCTDADADGLCVTHDCDDASSGCTSDCTDADGDGLFTCAGDCDDANPSCTTDCTDADGDGHCVTADCDDAKPYCTFDCTDDDGDDYCLTHDCYDADSGCTTDCTDADGDGFYACAEDCDDTRPGCTTDCRDADDDDYCVTTDCDEADPDTYPGAPETNDGKDNQCPGDAGHGLIDETTGNSGFHNPSDRTEYCWTAQEGATEYEVRRSSSPMMTSPCAGTTTTGTCWIDTETPLSGEVYHYLNRPTQTHLGSWGQDSAGVERTNVCP